MKKGFTIIEVMLAIFVMAVGIIGIYGIIPKIVSITAVNNNRFVAGQLALEAIEITRNFRDSNWLKGDDWASGLSFCSSGCEIAYDENSFFPFQNRYLKIDSNGFYNYQNGQDSKFKRKIIIAQQADVLDIEVEISWQGDYSPLVVKDKLYNWR